MISSDGQLAQRLWRSVTKSEACWEWTGARTTAGYGHFQFLCRHYYAHRLSYEIAFGAVPSGMVICHRCDNPKCVRPEHLFLGTHADNARDKVEKNRHVLPMLARARHPSAKLSESDVAEMRRRHTEDGTSGAALGRLFGVSTSQACNILRGDSWGPRCPS